MINQTKSKQEKAQECYHCGNDCANDNININGKIFCCNGCKSTYEILKNKNLCDYYRLKKQPGIKSDTSSFNKFRFLENKDIASKLYEFEDDYIATLSLHIPSIHCTSCIWLLENLNTLNPGIIVSRVNFPEKRIFLKINKNIITVKQLFELLYSIGYEPLAEKPQEDKSKPLRKKLYYKIGIAGFCFGNIMLLSFPEYLSSFSLDSEYRIFFGFLNIFFAVPLLYCASDYFISAYKGLKNKFINIDVPIALGLLIVFSRSLYEIISGTGAGYFDSLSGLVFFLLIGKLLQIKTYDTLNFERNYKSYLPIAVSLVADERINLVSLEQIKKGNRILVRNNEIVPADCILFKGNGNIDYSFVTGESLPVEKVLGEIIYAGGKQIGSSIELEVIRDVSQSYLTQLWNDEAFKKEEKNKFASFSDFIGKNFTIGVFVIVLFTAIYWLPVNIDRGLDAIIAVLIVACPCAFALSIPFAFGNSMKILGRNKFYIKNINVIERLARINRIIFDKTGTITYSNKSDISFVGRELTQDEKDIVKSLVKNSTHPYSRVINEHLYSTKSCNSEHYKEYLGKGIAGIVNEKLIKIGSMEFVYNSLSSTENSSLVYFPELDLLRFKENGSVTLNKDSKKINKSLSKVYLSINTEIVGHFEIKNKYKTGLRKIISELKEKFKLSVLSGDTSVEKDNLEKIFGHDTEMLFNRNAQEKLDYIKNLQEENYKCLMIGDGLNDAGALKQSNVGISVVDNINSFSPACDGILESNILNLLPSILDFAKANLTVLKLSFSFSLCYNLIGMYFAISGQLSPLVAAVLMPISSISVVLLAVFLTNYFAKKYKLL